MIVRDFVAEDIFRLAVQDEQEEMHRAVSRELAKSLEGYESFTALDGDRVLGCAGAVPIWSGRAAVWAYLARDLGPFMVPITREVRRFLDETEARRIEATAAWPMGCRWLEMLGFKLETPDPMQGYMPDGGPALLYSRVK